MSRKHNNNGNSADESEQIPLDRKLGMYKNPPSPKRPKNKKTLRQGLKDIYFEFCGNTSLHGVQYFGQRRPWKEIIFWIFIFIISIYFCTITIYSVYRKWDETPVIVSFSERSTPISSIPFPAITICSESKSYNFVDGSPYAELVNKIDEGPDPDLLSNLNPSALREFLTLLHICPSQPDNYTYFSETTQKRIDYIKALNEISIPLSDLFIQCSWGNSQNDECDDLFTKTYTEDGLCYTFNGFNGTDLYREDTVQYQVMGLDNKVNMTTGRLNRTLNWSLNTGYPKGIPLKTYPARVVSASSIAALDVIFQIDKLLLDYGCSGPTQGFKLVIHTPDDVPLMSKRFVRISLAKDVTIVVKPIMVTTSGRIEGYDPEKRKCYLAGERELRFFKVYSEKNCEMECLTNYTLRRCGCVKFSMPRTPDMEVCGADKIECYQGAEEHLLLENFADGDEDDDGCTCMPSCTSLEFDTEISQADIDIKQFLEALQMDGGNDTIVASLGIYFKDNEFITSKRSELFGLSEFLANCGGVLGLFMGFSFLSVVEILYHVTLRLWSNMTRRRDIN